MKYVSSENLKQVLQKMRNVFATKSELNAVKNQMGGGTLIEGYFKTNNGKGLYCKVLETDDKYEVWSNLKLSNSYSYTLSNLPTGKKILGNAIAFKRQYSTWENFVAGYGDNLVIRFDFSNAGIDSVNISGSDIGATQHSGQENDFVFLGSVIKR